MFSDPDTKWHTILSLLPALLQALITPRSLFRFSYLFPVFLPYFLKVHTSNKPKQQHINLVCLQVDTWTERALRGSGEFVSSDSESLYCSLMDPIPELYGPCTARRLSLADPRTHTAKGNAGMKTKDKGCLSKQRAAVVSNVNHRIQCPLLKREVRDDFLSSL